MGDKDGTSADSKAAATNGADLIPLSSPLFLHPSGNPGQLFGGDVLTDLNYNEWISDMKETLSAKNKIAFVNGTLPRPAATDLVRLNAWDRCDAMVKGWLKTAMTKEIRNIVRGVSTSREIWLDLRQRFSPGSATRAYELRRLIGALREDKSSVSAFNTRLRTYWDESQAVSATPRCSCSGCSCDVAGQVRAKLESKRLFDFLLGLDDAFVVIRSQVLSTKPLPSLAEAYQLAAGDEQQQQLTAGRRPAVDSAAFQVKEEKAASSPKPVRCSHSRKLGRTKDMCYRLHGFPTSDLKKVKQGEIRRSPGDAPPRQPTLKMRAAPFLGFRQLSSRT
ncbi:unnamed protein product [Linum trigynum]|uniref:Retrotransposon Copia-like N-terminal domain-containing protein n=1 Tax=Linum trigynum TaxID=586398 RepID=A0AAV2FMY0_9ROSI